MRRFDVVILGGGSGAEAICGAGLGGLSVAVVEELRFGGECPYLACMPSKAMLYSASLQKLGQGKGATQFAPGDYHAAVERRDRIAEHRDDAQHVGELHKLGAETIRGRGRVLERGLLEVNGERIEAGALVIATGSVASVPTVKGIDQVDYWLSDRLLSTTDLPESVIVLGGGPVGCELAQLLARYGCRTCLVEVTARLLAREEPELSEEVLATLRLDGVDVLLGAPVGSALQLSNGGVRIELEDGRQREAQVLIVATGREPRLRDLGLEAYGLANDARRLEVDPHCRTLGEANLFAVGDVTGVAPFTHTASYQGRVVAANLRGEDSVADYRAIPRAVYLDPPVAAVGLTRSQAQERGLVTASATYPLSETARALAEDVRQGVVVLVADTAEPVLLGAAVAGPGSDEGIAWAALAIKAKLPLDLLRDTVPPFPTYSEAYLAALDQLRR